MKNQIVTLFLFFAMAIPNALAIEIGDMIGSWKGKRKETVNGVGWYANATFKGSRRSDGGVSLTEKADTPTWGLVTAKHEFSKDGKYRMQARATIGIIVATYSGKWKKANGYITVSGTGGNIDGPRKISGKLKITKGKSFVYSGTSGTSRVILTGTKL